MSINPLSLVDQDRIFNELCNLQSSLLKVNEDSLRVKTQILISFLQKMSLHCNVSYRTIH